MHRSGNTPYTIRSFTLSAEQCWYRLAPFSKPVAQIQVFADMEEILAFREPWTGERDSSI
jgi:hypothetical protein